MGDTGVSEGVHFNISNGVFDTNELQRQINSTPESETTLITTAAMKQDPHHCFFYR
jgi:hypothetical protein